MAVFDIAFTSNALVSTSTASVILPQSKHICCDVSPDIQLGSFRANYPVMILLHDEASSQKELISMTAIERYASQAGVAVVLPTGMRGFYCNNYFRDPGYPIPGVKYANPDIEAKFTEMMFEDEVLNECLKLVRSIFPLSRDRNETYIAGIGMGGYGAMRLALRYPDMFSKAYSLSGYLDIRWMMENVPERKEQMFAVFGGEEHLDLASGNDLVAIVHQMASSEGKFLPELYQYWEIDSFSAQMNLNFKQAATEYPKYFSESTIASDHWEHTDRILKKIFNNLNI